MELYCSSNFIGLTNRNKLDIMKFIFMYHTNRSRYQLTDEDTERTGDICQLLTGKEEDSVHPHWAYFLILGT